MKRKIFIFIGLFAILLSAFSIPVNAQSNTAFYTNANGATLTEEQYNYLIDFFSETTLYTMTAEQLNFVKNETNLTKTTETKYIKHGSTWFNQKCWNDVYEIKKTQEKIDTQMEILKGVHNGTIKIN